MGDTEPHAAERQPTRDRSGIVSLLAVGFIGLFLGNTCSGGPDPTVERHTPTAIEGVSTAGCVRSDIILTLNPGQGFYLGDRTVDGDSTRDAFSVTNVQGAIIYDQSPDDDGRVQQIQRGFEYTENGGRYIVEYVNWEHTLGGVIEVSLLTECREPNQHGPEYT